MTNYPIPAEMAAVVLDAYEGPEHLRVERRPVPATGKNEVLVKMAAASVNPSDLSFLAGRYRFRKPLPAIPGFEGSGTVMATGGGLLGRYLLGRRVACVSQAQNDGVWAEYAAVKAGYALVLHKSVSLEQGAVSAVNPLTAVVLVSLARAGGHKAFINNAAASALGRMLERLARREGLQVINVVRQEEQVVALRAAGSPFALNSEDLGFDQSLRDLCREHEVRLAFDAVAGEMTGRLLAAMPAGARVTVYGGLSHRPAQVAGSDLIYWGKQVDGFLLSNWTSRQSFIGNLRLWRRAQGLMTSELFSEVRACYPLERAREAVLAYQENMSAGKVLLVP